MVKVISLSDEAYGRLKALKGERSFSEIVIEFTAGKKKRNILDFFGAFADNKNKWAEISKKIYEDRKKIKTREVNF